MIIKMLNFVFSRLTLLKNIFIGKVTAKINAFYWKYYQSKWMLNFEAFLNNKSSYVKVLLVTVWNKVLGKKVIVVHVTINLHYSIISSIIDKISAKYRCKVLIFSSFELESSKQYRYFSSKDLIPTRGRRFLPVLWADLYLTPTSEVADVIQANCPKVVFMHSLMGINGIYEEDTFDGYDYVICAGKHHLQEFSDLFSHKKLKGKCLVPGGYTKLDSQINQARCIPGAMDKCVIIAPTLLFEATEESSLLIYGKEIVDNLLSRNFKVILRPHPVNLQRDNTYFDVISSLIDSFSTHPNFELDTQKDYINSYASSAVMLSDISGTAYTYAFAYCKPVLFFNPRPDTVFNQGLLFEQRELLGEEITSVHEIDNALRLLESNYEVYQASIAKTRDEFIFNIGKSAGYITENLDYLLTGRKHDEWTYI